MDGGTITSLRHIAPTVLSSRLPCMPRDSLSTSAIRHPLVRHFRRPRRVTRIIWCSGYAYLDTLTGGGAERPGVQARAPAGWRTGAEVTR